MPAAKHTPAPPTANELLAAIDRAERHEGRKTPGVLLGTIKEHLGLPRHGATTLQLRPILGELEAASLIERSRRDRADLWKPTTKGRKRLQALQGTITLPEAPQHRRWREARAAAQASIDTLRIELHSELADAEDALEADPTPSSAALYELGERVSRGFAHLASATYCLHEWAEPDDESADADDPPYKQHGRREIKGWQRSPGAE